MNIHKTALLFCLCSSFLISGCTAVAVGSAATTGVAIAHDRRTTGTVVDDQTVELKALRTLYADDSIRINTHINATSYNGVLLLTGEAPTEALRSHVINQIRRIPNIRKIHNEILLAAPSAVVSRSSDAYVTSKAKITLLTLNHIQGFDPTRVKVVTENGVVYLLGLLKQHEVNPVVETIRRVGGVQRVIKLIEIIA